MINLIRAGPSSEFKNLKRIKKFRISKQDCASSNNFLPYQNHILFNLSLKVKTAIKSTKFTIFFIAFTLQVFLQNVEALKCLDCVGRDCMGSFCDGDVCVLSQYAPRWGTIEWGEAKIVKGCMTGSLLRKNIRNHCETADEDGQEVFTCFCNNKDYCNGDKAVEKLEIEPIQLLTCACEGSHCKGPTCLGELCSYVINHSTKQTEQGCVNASVPLIERRSSGACMIPPITGAMHHTVAKNAEDLLSTESCVCGIDYCNMDKPQITVPERMNCQTFVRAEIMGTKMASRNLTCTGEYCFKAKILSKIGHMSSYNTIGCASFVKDSELAEELNPTGCAKFTSENLQVETCIQTTDKKAISRARANQQGVQTRPKPKAKAKPKMEITYDESEEDEENNEKGGEKSSLLKKEKSRYKEIQEKEELDKEETENEEADEDKPTTQQHYIFERPTLPPEVEDSNNTTLVSVFLLLILLIVLSGAVWKLQLHKRLFRANYDTVAGG